MKIYVASSWRNEEQPDIVAELRGAGHQVYDFRHPEMGDDGFHWSQIDPAWKEWSPGVYRKCLDHPIAVRGFENDRGAMEWADVLVGVMPFGRSASFEMGWAAGYGKRTILLLATGEPELMVKMFDRLCLDMAEVLQTLDQWQRSRVPMEKGTER